MDTMDTVVMYSEQLETRMISQFRERFFEKLGYYPIVIAKTTQPKSEKKTIWTLEDLEKYFEPYLPEIHGRVLRLPCKYRNRPIVELRMIFCSIARSMGNTCKSIGEFLGNRDHTTVLHAVATFNDLMFIDENFRNKYHMIISDIKKDLPDDPSTMDNFDPVPDQSQSAVLP